MTHVKQVESFTRLIGFCSGFGGYNPGRQSLQIDALTTTLGHIQSAMENVKIAKAEYNQQVNQRKQVFDQIPRMLAGILRRLEASGAKPEQLEDARAYVHQFIGAVPKIRAAVPSEQTESTASPKGRLQLAYVSKADSFSNLVKTVMNEPLYRPHEQAYTIAGLEATGAELIRLNQAVADARKHWRMALIERNNVLYRNEESMLRLGRAVKRYVRGLFGLASGEYALLKEITFKPA